MEFRTLVIRVEGNGNQVWIKGQKETLELYGWHLHYDEWKSKGEREGGPGRFTSRHAKQFGSYGGQSLRVSRSPRRQGHEAGMVNVIRIHSHVTNNDLAELVALSSKRIEWMENKAFKRIGREEWMAVYAGVPVSRLLAFA